MKTAALITLIAMIFIDTPARAATREKNIYIKHAGFKRHALVLLPPDFKLGERHPLVLAFHGVGGNAGEFDRTSAEFNALAGRAGVIVAYPDARRGRWEDTNPNKKHPRDDLGFIDQLIERSVRDFHADPGRIFAMGMSNGGTFVFRLACERSEKIAAGASVAMNMGVDPATSCSPVRKIPLLIVIGDKDPIIPFGGGIITDPQGISKRVKVFSADETARFWVKTLGCEERSAGKEFIDTDAKDGTSVEKTSWNACYPGARLVQYIVHEGGHGWPGRKPRFNRAFLGRVSRDIDASQKILDFFLKDNREKHP